MSPAPAQQLPAIEIAFAEHRAFVRERLRGLGVAAADLDDATQDVFEVLVRRIADYDPNRPIRAWMAGMARKVARRYRDRGRRVIVPLDERRLVSELSPEDRAAQTEAWQVLQRFLDELEPERWAVFVLSEIEGLRGSEIAAELGVNQNTVYARLRSARRAFERSLRRQRARERRGAWAVFSWRWLAPAVVVGGVSLGVVTLIAAGHCGVDESTSEQARLHSESEIEIAAQPGDPPNPRMLAADTMAGPNPADEVWVEGASGFAIGSNQAGERYTLSIESRHRLVGDRVILEITYIGDDDVVVDAIGHELTIDGLELIDGQLAWEREVPAGEVRVVTTTLRAARDGVVRLRATAKRPSGGGSGSRRYAWVRERGQLRACDEHECAAPVGEEQLSGERITVHVHNQCEVTKQFVLFAGYPDVRPSESVTIHSLQAGERRTMEIDAAQWFLHVDADGQIGGGVRTSDEGASVVFLGTGDDCSQSSARSPNLPPEGDASPFGG